MKGPRNPLRVPPERVPLWCGPRPQELSKAAAGAASDYEGRLRAAASALGMDMAGGFPR